MALVCDIKSEEDLEDGEIEDDDEEVPVPQVEAAAPPEKVISRHTSPSSKSNSDKNERSSREKSKERRARHEDKPSRKHMTEAEKSILHLRKREKMQREKWEKLHRKEHVVVPPMVAPEPMDDDFAKNIQKTLETILNKKEKEKIAATETDVKDEDKREEKRGKKRKKHDKERQKNKQRRLESPKVEEMDENEMLNVRGGSPSKEHDPNRPTSPTHSSASLDSECSSDPTAARTEERSSNRAKRDEKKSNRRNRRERKQNRERERRMEPQLKDAQDVCVFYLQGKCQKNDCPYSHEALPPMKLELCKFYLMECCAKGDKCSYMHSEFPCKFYHTGLTCSEGDNCKFAHGKPLSEGLKQILFKHIETAPRDILGGFPRMSREEALKKINESQKLLHEQFGVAENKDDKNLIPSLFDISVSMPSELTGPAATEVKQEKPEVPPQQPQQQPTEKPSRNRRSRWQDADPEPAKEVKLNFPVKPFSYGQDQDMRINSNGDIDMRTLPPPTIPTTINPIVTQPPPALPTLTNTKLTEQPPIAAVDTDIRPIQDSDIRATKDVDSRLQFSNIYDDVTGDGKGDEDEPMLQIDEPASESEETSKFPSDMPKVQKELFMRIQANQKENVPENDKPGFEIDDNINWYSDDDDDDDNRLTIKVEGEEREKEEVGLSGDNDDRLMSPPQIKPLEVVEKLGDLSKIDISAEVTKLLTSMSQTKGQFTSTSAAEPSESSSKTVRDPRTAKSDPRNVIDPRLGADPRRSRTNSLEAPLKSDRISIYDQGSIEDDSLGRDLDLDNRGTGRPDVDLRDLALPFKGMANYTPATEIDGSINSHPAIIWKVYIVDIPRPDYTGLKLCISDAEKTGDPRLKKIFRLSIDEKDSPASPKASPKATLPRVDPRLRKTEDKSSIESIGMNYTQQLNMLQSSNFYQSLTSNQKVQLNAELSTRSDQTGLNDPFLSTLLSNLNIIPGVNATTPNLTAVLSILANVTKLNPALLASQPPPGMVNAPVNPALLGQNSNLMTQMAQSIVAPGLLGAAPGIPNLPPDFPMNFDPRNGGLLGNAPPFGNFSNDNNGPPPQQQQQQQQQQGGNFGNYNNDDYHPHQDNGGNFGGYNNNVNNRDNRFNNNNNNRDHRRRGRNNFNNRNNGNRNFRNRNNRSNRSHTPP